ncbi:hematopoietic prostaglandin D synthase-like [Amphiura filiformis]|uniref:hematopoietic prostaglandin D synthase-like n=1 Tax=Amphiura filiformis TaxID=82378 RepID=UPI003B20F1AC
MSKPKYKLIYFNSKGRAEVTRLLFHLAGYDYEDVRITDEQWHCKYKLDMPCKQVPVLFIDDEPLTQSKAIARYVAKQTDFYGQTNSQCARIDAVMDVCNDWHYSMVKWFGTGDPEVQESWVRVLREEAAPTVCSNLETLLRQNNGGDGYFVGDTITVADLFVFCDIEVIQAFVDDLLAKYPKLSALFDRVASNEKVAEWVKTRPHTKY